MTSLKTIMFNIYSITCNTCLGYAVLNETCKGDYKLLFENEKTATEKLMKSQKSFQYTASDHDTIQDANRCRSDVFPLM